MREVSARNGELIQEREAREAREARELVRECRRKYQGSTTELRITKGAFPVLSIWIEIGTDYEGQQRRSRITLPYPSPSPTTSSSAFSTASSST